MADALAEFHDFFKTEFDTFDEMHTDPQKRSLFGQITTYLQNVQIQDFDPLIKIDSILHIYEKVHPFPLQFKYSQIIVLNDLIDTIISSF